MLGLVGPVPVPGSVGKPARVDTNEAASSTESFTMRTGTQICDPFQQLFTTTLPPAMRCQLSAVSKDGNQLAFDRFES